MKLLKIVKIEFVEKLDSLEESGEKTKKGDPIYKYVKKLEK